MAAALAELHGGGQRKANRQQLHEGAAAGCALCCLALEHRRLLELSRGYAKLRRQVAPGPSGGWQVETRVRQAGCASGRLYYAEGSGALNPQVLPREATLLRTPARAASAASLHDGHATGLLPPEGRGRGGARAEVVAFARGADKGCSLLGERGTAPLASLEMGRAAGTEGSSDATPAPACELPAGVYVGRLEGIARGCSVATCAVRASAGGEAARLSLAELWGYGAEAAGGMAVALLSFERPPPDQPALVLPAGAGGAETEGGAAGAEAGGPRALVPWPADRVHGLLSYAAVQWSDWAAPGARPPEPHAAALLESTHPPPGALLVRPSRRIRVALRGCVRARPGCLLVSADYRSAELAVVAHLSADEGLLRALGAERDPFEAIALAMRPPSARGADGGGARVGADERGAAKAACYSLLYGAGCARVEAAFFGAFPRVGELIARLQQSCAQPGAAVHTPSGRRRLLSEAERADASLIRRRALNAVCQGCVADLLKGAMLANDDLEERLRASLGFPVHVRLLMQLHDELVYEVGPAPPHHSARGHGASPQPLPQPDVLRHAVEGIVDGMTGAGRRAQLLLPLRVAVKVGLSWGGAEEYHCSLLTETL